MVDLECGEKKLGLIRGLVKLIIVEKWGNYFTLIVRFNELFKNFYF